MDFPSDKEPEMRAAYQKTRKSLIERLGNWEDQRSWDEFYQTYYRLIYSVAVRAGLSHEEAFDVVQETVIGIAKQVQRKLYDPQAGSFKTWLLNMTRWRIADQFRRRMRDPALPNRVMNEDSEASSAEMMDRLPDPKGDELDQVWDSEWKKNLTNVAVARVKSKVSPKQFQIFDCYVLKGWGVKKTVETLGVNAAQVYLARHRVGSLVKKEVRILENQLL
jgi:RNA polymerase sigma factor (sigma-70 family)